MSDSETFLARWLRLKGQSEGPLPPAGTPSLTAFDPASLPSLDSIVGDTDIQPFLHGAVPTELTRAALRKAWAADPAIRDFIGIAENQWDFNDQACIPGFGPLEAADYLATRALQTLTDAKQEAPQDGAGDAGPSQVEPGAAVPPAVAPPGHEGITIAVATAKAEETGMGEFDVSGSAVQRVHGGALPK